MRKLLLFSLLIICSAQLSAQAFVKGTGIRYDRGVPTVAPDTTYGTELVYDLTNRVLYMWDRTNEAWVKQLNVTRSAGVPSGDPGNAPDVYVNTTTEDLYWWNGSSWDQLNGGGGGGGDVTQAQLSDSTEVLRRLDTTSILLSDFVISYQVGGVEVGRDTIRGSVYNIPNVSDTTSISNPKKGDHAITTVTCATRLLFDGDKWNILQGTVPTNPNVLSTQYVGTEDSIIVPTQLEISSTGTDSVSLRSFKRNGTELLSEQYLFDASSSLCSYTSLSTLLTGAGSTVSSYTDNSACDGEATVDYSITVSIFDSIEYVLGTDLSTDTVKVYKTYAEKDTFRLHLSSSSINNLASISDNNVDIDITISDTIITIIALSNIPNSDATITFTYCNSQEATLPILIDFEANTVTLTVEALTLQGVENSVPTYKTSGTLQDPSLMTLANNRATLPNEVKITPSVFSSYEDAVVVFDQALKEWTLSNSIRVQNNLIFDDGQNRITANGDGVYTGAYIQFDTINTVSGTDRSVLIQTGNPDLVADHETGDITLRTGPVRNNPGKSGDINIETGSSTSSAPTGDINIKTGGRKIATGQGGGILLQTQNVTTNDGSGSGDITISTRSNYHPSAQRVGGGNIYITGGHRINNTTSQQANNSGSIFMEMGKDSLQTRFEGRMEIHGWDDSNNRIQLAGFYPTSYDFSGGDQWNAGVVFPNSRLGVLTPINDIDYDLHIGGNQAVKISTGTTAQQPTASLGLIRADSDTDKFTIATDLGWDNIATESWVNDNRDTVKASAQLSLVGQDTIASTSLNHVIGLSSSQLEDFTATDSTLTYTGTVGKKFLLAYSGYVDTNASAGGTWLFQIVPYDNNVAVGSAECRVGFSTSGVDSKSTPFTGNKILELNTNDVIDLRASSTAGLTTIIRILNLSITEL